MKNSFVLFFTILIALLGQKGWLLGQEIEELSQTSILERVQSAEGIVEDIVLRGNQTLKDKKILNSLLVKKGEKIDVAKIRSSFKNLYQSGLFADINFLVELDEISDNITLIIEIVEYPTISKIEFAGNRQFKRVTLIGEIDIARKKSYRANEVILAREDIIAKYVGAGFNNVRVDYSVNENKEDNTVSIVFFIEEGVRMLVKDIRFTNNTVLKDLKLRTLMETKKTGWARRVEFTANKFELDKEKIVYAFQSEGYADAKIVESNFSYRWKNPKKKNIQFISIDMEIEEGELYFFGTTTIRGNTVFSKTQLERGLKRKTGKAFDQSVHDADVGSIYQIYQQQGYIFSRVTPIAKTNEDNTIDYVLDIYEGRKAHVERIFVEGLIKTKEYVVMRELSIEEGEIFNVTELRASLLRLNRLGYFSEIKPDYQPGSAEGLMNIILNVKEQQTGVVSGGISYSTLYGLSVIFSLEEKNLLGKGQTLELSLSYGVLVKEFKFSFIEPWIAGKRISLGGSVTLAKYYRNFYTNQTLLDTNGNRIPISYPNNGSSDLVQNTPNAIRYTEDLISLSIFSSQTLKNWFSITEGFSINYSREYLQDFTIFPERYKQTEVYELNKDLFDPAPPINERNLYYVLSATVSRDRRNSQLNPTRGTLARLGTYLFVGDYRLTKWQVDVQTLWPIVSIPETLIAGAPWHLTVSYKARFRTVGNSIQGDFSYPDRLLYQFFRTDLRGWDYDSIYRFREERFGKNTFFAGLPYGKALIEHEFELRMGFPIDIVQLALFWEFGNLNVEPLGFDQKGSAFLFDFENYLYDLGFGFRINLPVFPIRFYWVWRYAYDNASDSFYVYRPGGRFLGIDNTVVPTFIIDFQANF